LRLVFGLMMAVPGPKSSAMGRKENLEVTEEERRPTDRKLTREGALTIVLLRPRIPQNTGAIARMCAATGFRLDLVEPLFKLDDTKLKRAGLDYWPLLDVRTFANFEEWRTRELPGKRIWLLETKGRKTYAQAAFRPGDLLVFGDEQEGIDPGLLEANPESWLRIPQQGVRSLNLAMSVGIVSYEALRQLNWLGLESM